MQGFHFHHDNVIKIRFTNDELSSLNSYVSKAGYTSREKYIRTVLLENVPKRISLSS